MSANKPAELSKADLAAIRERFDSVARHVSARNYDAWANDFTADGIFMFAHSPTVRGRKAMREWAEAFPKVDRLSFADLEIHGGGEIAWATSTYRIAFESNPAPDTGKQLVVLQRQADGAWLSRAANVSSDAPLGSSEADLGVRILAANDELLSKGNVARARELFSPDYVVHFNGEELRGTQAIEQYVTELRAAFPDLRYEIAILASAGDKISWMRTHRGTQKGAFMGVPASGRAIAWRDMVVSRYAGGKIAEEWAVTDIGQHLRAP